MKKHLLWFFLLAATLNAQSISGLVFTKTREGKMETIAGAVVYLKATTIATITDSSGRFTISIPDSLPALLITSMLGYRNDTLKIVGDNNKEIAIELKQIMELNEVEIAEKQQSTLVKIFTPINLEVITSKELQKAACCNLSESFSTNGTVDVAFTDAVSGAKKIQMLGLDGVYTQMLAENMPTLRGLSAAYGLNYVPGTWIESIAVTKGSGSVVNGYEGITGQINLEYLKPKEQKKRLFLNVYANHKSRLETNLHYTPTFKNNKWGTMLMAHASDLSMRHDMNNDSFLDMPLTRQYNIFNRWDYHNQKNVEAQFGIKAMYENRQAGQTTFNVKEDNAMLRAYGVGIKTSALEYFTKTGFVFRNEPLKSIGIQTSGKWQEQEMFFGVHNYKGVQQNFYANIIYANIIGTTNHKYKLGSSYMYDDYNESLNDSAFSRTESVPGVFAEYTYTHPNNFSMIAGMRIDNNSLYGMFYTPRLHLRYNATKSTTLRASAGRGYRAANVFIENQAVLASSRKIIVTEKFKPEVAWNYGLSINQQFKLFAQNGFINIDFFRTNFENQVVVDLDKDVHQVQFYNLKGKSFSNSIQADLAFSPRENFDVKLTYKFLDVESTYHQIQLSKPYVSKHRWMMNIAYSTFKEVWKFDFTTRWYGKSRIPSTLQNPVEFQQPATSKEYFLLQAQITKKFRKFVVYLGCENLLNYTQSNAIIDSQNPFGVYFDASMIYAPMDGRIIYTGIRLEIK